MFVRAIAESGAHGRHVKGDGCGGVGVSAVRTQHQHRASTTMTVFSRITSQHFTLQFSGRSPHSHRGSRDVKHLQGQGECALGTGSGEKRR